MKIHEIQQEMLNKNMWKCCINCNNYKEEYNICLKMKEGVKVPIKLIVVGCHRWESYVPF